MSNAWRLIWESKFKFLLINMYYIMKILFNDEEFKTTLSTQKLPLQCKLCSSKFYAVKTRIAGVMHSTIGKNSGDSTLEYCSVICSGIAKRQRITLCCSQCNKKFESIKYRKKSKSGNSYCSRSCSVTYNNTHKTIGTRRSKLEVWLEQQLKTMYPELIILFNNKETINSELDIYMPSLNIAFELNGIFHYEPIYGSDKLNKIQNNDNRKFQACLEKNISLVIIDSSGMINFKPNKAQRYLNIIISIMDVELKQLGIHHKSDWICSYATVTLQPEHQKQA